MRLRTKVIVILMSCAFSSILLRGPAVLAVMLDEAQGYREKGLHAQEKRDYDSAVSYYKKAVELDPYNALVYNDLGVTYEAMKEIDRAEEAYLMSLRLDPGLLAVYFNLGALYDKKGNLRKAAQFYMRRVKMGSGTDPWVVKSKQRLYEIAEELPDIKHDLLELEARDLNLQITEPVIPSKNLPGMGTPQYHIIKGNTYYNKGDYLSALTEYSFAMQLDPRNPEADRLVKKAQRRVLVK